MSLGRLWGGVNLINLSHISVAAAVASARLLCGMTGLSWCPGEQRWGQAGDMGTKRGGEEVEGAQRGTERDRIEKERQRERKAGENRTEKRGKKAERDRELSTCTRIRRKGARRRSETPDISCKEKQKHKDTVTLGERPQREKRRTNEQAGRNLETECPGRRCWIWDTDARFAPRTWNSLSASPGLQSPLLAWRPWGHCWDVTNETSGL